jgi:hypothetical protein
MKKEQIQDQPQVRRNKKYKEKWDTLRSDDKALLENNQENAQLQLNDFSNIAESVGLDRINGK